LLAAGVAAPAAAPVRFDGGLAPGADPATVVARPIQGLHPIDIDTRDQARAWHR
jgi:hypothetical protein